MTATLTSKVNNFLRAQLFSHCYGSCVKNRPRLSLIACATLSRNTCQDITGQQARGGVRWRLLICQDMPESFSIPDHFLSLMTGVLHYEVLYLNLGPPNLALFGS